MNRRLVGIIIFPEVEVLDFCGPYEVWPSPACTRSGAGTSLRRSSFCWWPTYRGDHGLRRAQSSARLHPGDLSATGRPGGARRLGTRRRIPQ